MTTSATSSAARARQIRRYVRTGRVDSELAAWPGGLIERERAAKQDLRAALLQAIREREVRCAPGQRPELDVVELTRRKVRPMIEGLFPKSEQAVVLATVEQSVVFVHGDNIEVIVGKEGVGSAWTLSNMYLASIGAELLGPRFRGVLGVNTGTTCYVSMKYLGGTARFDDYLVHEVAHAFHFCKRRLIGLRHTRAREWLLDIEFSKREAFAYACEAYAWIREHAKSGRERAILANEYANDPIHIERVDGKEVATIVSRACAARNGWKVILAACARPPWRVRMAEQRAFVSVQVAAAVREGRVNLKLR